MVSQKQRAKEIAQQVSKAHCGIAPYTCYINGVEIWEPYGMRGLEKQIEEALNEIGNIEVDVYVP
jgi:hypothetical protein